MKAKKMVYPYRRTGGRRHPHLYRRQSHEFVGDVLFAHGRADGGVLPPVAQAKRFRAIVAAPVFFMYRGGGAKILILSVQQKKNLR